ncbi:hypothetical protein C8J57DRAFT_1065836 [Mycena rebaudengoi]|nr:hypothetical protein C8J57DRAFT_1065836 [Mycena rebaudengoi]
MCEGGYDGLSQCLLNQELLEDDRWRAERLRLPLLPEYSLWTWTYRWIPAQTRRSWTSLRGDPFALTNLSSEYHNLPQLLGARYTVPDIAEAFNSGASELDTASWKRTITFLVSQKSRACLRREEHLIDGGVLSANGARLIDGLGPCRNPLGSLLGKKNYETPCGFYSESMYLAGGFKGS